jgi:hypothetical protein
VFRPSSGVTRRAFLKAACAALALPRRLNAQARIGRETLFNGIVLPSPWPPRRSELADIPARPSYLSAPPPVIDIDVGRQLFIDDFLVQESGLHRTFHRATYYEGNPVLVPEGEIEQQDPHAALTRQTPSPTAMPFSDGVFFDPGDRLFKMWYMAGYQQFTALAHSRDGIHWVRPRFDVIRGTNVVSTRRRDSSTVWLDLDSADREARYKMAAYDLEMKALRLHVSRDGVHWRERGVSGPCGDRSTVFYNPFRKVWVFSLRHDTDGQNRSRRYFETADFTAARWTAGQPVTWIGADALDVARAEMATPRQLYNLDAVAYESVMLGLFTIYRGERPDREKPNDLCVGFSRDGFHWSRLSRDPFIPVSERPGDWNWSNVQSAGGGCLVVGDRLHFYVSGRAGVAGTDLPGRCTTGLATLRRDGFASVSDAWPAGTARAVGGDQSSLATRPVRFSGKYLFVNADISGDLRVEILDAAGEPIEAYAAARAVPVRGNGTRLAVQWQGGRSLEELAGRVVRFRFSLSRARLYAFWVSPSQSGESRGYVGAGGPGYSGVRDDA